MLKLGEGLIIKKNGEGQINTENLTWMPFSLLVKKTDPNSVTTFLEQLKEMMLVEQISYKNYYRYNRKKDETVNNHMGTIVREYDDDTRLYRFTELGKSWLLWILSGDYQSTSFDESKIPKFGNDHTLAPIRKRLIEEGQKLKDIFDELKKSWFQNDVSKLIESLRKIKCHPLTLEFNELYYTICCKGILIFDGMAQDTDKIDAVIQTTHDLLWNQLKGSLSDDEIEIIEKEMASPKIKRIDERYEKLIEDYFTKWKIEVKVST